MKAHLRPIPGHRFPLTTKSSEEVPLNRNFKKGPENKNYTEVELKRYPTLSVYSWETESLRLSQSPHDMWEGPGPNLVMFLHPKCLQVSSSPRLLFKAAVRCSGVLCTNVFYINVLYILCSGEYLLQEWRPTILGP